MMTMEERIEKLEGELKRQKRRSKVLLTAMSVIVAICFLALASMGPLQGARADSEGEVVAREIILVDEAGNARVRLGAGREQPGLALMGPDGAVFAVFSAHGDGSYLVLNNSRGKHRLILSVDGKGAGLNIFDDKGTVRAAMAQMDANTFPDLNLYDAEQEQVWSALSPVE